MVQQTSHSFLFSLLHSPAFVAGILATIVLVSGTMIAITRDSSTNAPVVVIPVGTERESAFVLTATQESAKGIAPTTTFRLLTAVAATEDFVKEHLNFQPNIAYAVEPIEEQEFLITLDEPLETNTIVNARMQVALQNQDGSVTPQTYSWAYQVEEIFQVVAILPRDHSQNVPVDTGIEFVFSHQDFQNAENNFSIEPNVPGRFEVHRNTLAFIPDKPLEYAQLYTVRLGKEVSLPATNETLAQDIVVQFETGEEDVVFKPGITTIAQKTLEVSTNATPSFMVWGSDLENIKTTQLSVYQYPNREAYFSALQSYLNIPTWAYTTQRQWHATHEGLALHSKTDVTLQPIDQYYQMMVEAPQPLAQGYYLLEIPDANNEPLSALVIVSDISAYVTISETNTVVWSHDMKTGEPLHNATVTLQDGTELGHTDAHGVLNIPTPKSILDHLDDAVTTIAIAAGSKELIIPLFGNSQGVTAYDHSQEGRVQAYWNYLYLDQPVYRSNDTVNFWGVAKQRENNETTSVKISLRDGGDWQHDGTVLMEADVHAGNFGTFEGSLRLPNLVPNYYSLVVEVNGEQIIERSVIVQTFTKPAYALSITPERIGVIAGTAVTHTIAARFYSGAPVSNVELSLGDEKFKTDETGRVTQTKIYTTSGATYESNEDLYVQPALPEEGDISATGSVTIFPAAETIVPEGTVNGTQGVVKATVRTIDLEGYNRGDYQVYEKSLGDAVLNRPVEVIATRHWYTRRDTGTRYDFIQKKAVPQYEYDRHEEEVARGIVTTDRDGNMQFTFDIKNNDDLYPSYSVLLRLKDSEGRIAEETVYLFAGNSDPSYANGFFSLQFADSTGQFDVRRDFSIGDDVHITFLRDGEKLADTAQDHFLYIGAKDGIRQVVPQSSAEYSFTFGKEHIPSILLQGVWFDGRSYWVTDSQLGVFRQGTIASFQEKDRELNVAVTSDYDSYKPGDDVRLSLQVTRPDGSGTEAVVNVNIIDEALFAVLGNDVNVNFNQALYKDAESGIYQSYASHRYPTMSFGAEGGGSMGARNAFPDKALFKTIATDRDGKAEITFTLPDNLTSWHVTAHALDEDYFAGNGAGKVLVSQPFFVDAVMNTSYLTDDQSVITVRTFGEGITQQSPVSITISSQTLAMDEVTQTTTGFSAINVPLPKLSQGTHEILIRAKSGENEDAIIRTITVVPSRLAISKTNVATVTNGWKPNVDTDQNFDVIFMDDNKGQYYPILQTLRNIFGDRLDQIAARVLATEMLNTNFGEQEFVEQVETSNYQIPNKGGLALFPYSDEDLLLSAHIAASTLADRFDAAHFVSHFNGILNDTSQTTLRRAQSLYGLSALHEPVLNEVKTVLASDKITDEDRLYLGLALAQLGDFDGAQGILDQLRGRYGKVFDERLAFLNLGDTEDARAINTMLAAIIAAIVQDDQADALFNYARERSLNDVTLALPQVNFINARLQTLSAKSATITYTHLGKEERVTLEKGLQHRVALTKDSVESFVVTNIDGYASALIHFNAKPTADDLQSFEGMSVKRSYDHDVIHLGDLVRVAIDVTIPETAPDSEYQITDNVPSGLQVVSKYFTYDAYGEMNYQLPYRIDGQRIFFSASKSNHSFWYLARVLNKGTFVAEQPILQSFMNPSVRSFGELQTIFIE